MGVFTTTRVTVVDDDWVVGSASPELAEPVEGLTTTRVTVVLTTTSASPELAEPAEGDDDDTDTDDDDDNDGLDARRRRHGPGDDSKTTPGSGGAKGKAALLAQSLELGWEPDVGAARDDKDNLVGYWRFVEVWSSRVVRWHLIRKDCLPSLKINH